MAAFMAFSYCSEEGNYVSSKNAKAFLSIFTHIQKIQFRWQLSAVSVSVYLFQKIPLPLDSIDAVTHLSSV